MLNCVELYLDKVNILLNFIRFQRTGNWEGFLHALKKFILFCFALNQNNYARNLPYHYISMLNLHESHPSIYEYLKIVGFTASFSVLPFSETPCDRIIVFRENWKHWLKWKVDGPKPYNGCYERTTGLSYSEKDYLKTHRIWKK